MKRMIVALLTGVVYLVGIGLAFAQISPKWTTEQFQGWNSIREYEEATGKRIEKFNEAPTLKVKVAAGELPPVERRLPPEPVVIKPLEEVGQYGGTVHLVIDAPNRMYGDPQCFITPEGILGIGTDYKSVVPALAKDWEFSKDGKTLTLFLRKGIKWSDGVPFTADDLMFWYEDVLLNDELTPVKSQQWKPGGKLMKMEKVDDYTVRLHFAAPYPIIVLELAHYSGGEGGFYWPKHYLKQFHPRYTPIEKLEKMAKDEGYDYWYQLFRRKAWAASGGITLNPELPTLNPFVLKERGPENLIFERNPYYWKVDTAGNQLPYIDRVFISVVSDLEMVNAKIITGAVDFGLFGTQVPKYPLYKANAEKGNYRVLDYHKSDGADIFFDFNLCSKDPVLRKIFRDVRFRRAMSLAINREEINDTLYFGMATPRAMTVIPYSKYFEPEFAKAYAEYDPKKANALLDEIGLDKRDKEGYRLRPDGKRLVLIIEHCEPSDMATPITEMVREYWAALGIQVKIKLDTRELLSTRAAANEIDVSEWTGSRSIFTFPKEPLNWTPVRPGDEVIWSNEWSRWYVTEGKAGEEPPEEIKELHELWEKMKTTMDEEERIRLGKELLRRGAENVWTIGTVGMAPKPCVVRKNLRNIPKTALKGYDIMRLVPRHPEQFFFKQR